MSHSHEKQRENHLLIHWSFQDHNKMKGEALFFENNEHETWQIFGNLTIK